MTYRQWRKRQDDKWWRRKARSRWPDHRVVGGGPFARVTDDTVYLYPTPWRTFCVQQRLGGFCECVIPDPPGYEVERFSRKVRYD